MFKSVKTLAITGLVALPAAAFAAVSVGDHVGISEDEIRTKLESQGYTVQEIEFEDGEIEVEAIIDGVEVEIELAEKTGEVIEIETEDDDD